MRLRPALVLVLLLLLFVGGGVALVLSPVPTSAHDAADAADAAGAAGAAVRGDGASVDDAAGVRDAGRRRHVSAPRVVDGRHGDHSGGIGASGDEPAPQEPALETPAPESPAPEPEHVRGRVVDFDGKPIVGARVLAVRVGSGWHGDRTAADGSFAPELTDGDGPVEIRIAMPGFRTVIQPWTEGGDGDVVTVRLEARDAPPLFGTLRGFATDAAGKPLSGRLLVEGNDEMRDYLSTWALADAGGNFEVVGFPPGHWGLRLYSGPGAAEFVDVIVPEDDVARVHLRAGAGTDAGPWPGELDDETFAALHRELSEQMTVMHSDAELSVDESEHARWVVVRAMQDLEARRRGTAPTREVVVLGLPDVPYAVLCAASTQGPNHRWTARIEDGRARFAALTHETWQLALLVPGEAARPGPTVDVVARDPESSGAEGAPQSVAWKPAR